jgi:hypothetical protein
MPSRNENEDPSEKDLTWADRPRDIQHMEVWRARTMVPDEFYIRASRWLQKVLDKLILKPIAPKRFAALHSRLWRELSNRASDHKTTPYYELYAEAATALHGLLPEVGKVWMNIPSSLFDPADPDAPKAQEYVLKEIHHQINKKVTEIILGEGWWRAEKEQPFEEDDAVYLPANGTGKRYRRRHHCGAWHQLPDRMEENQAILDCWLLDDERLAPREHQLLKAMIQVEMMPAETRRKNGTLPIAARQLKIKPATARNMISRIRKKIRTRVS